MYIYIYINTYIKITTYAYICVCLVHATHMYVSSQVSEEGTEWAEVECSRIFDGNPHYLHVYSTQFSRIFTVKRSYMVCIYMWHSHFFRSGFRGRDGVGRGGVLAHLRRQPQLLPGGHQLLRPPRQGARPEPRNPLPETRERVLY